MGGLATDNAGVRYQDKTKRMTGEVIAGLTNGPDDGGTTIVFSRLVLGVEPGGPFQLHSVCEVVKRVRHPTN